MTCRRDLVVSIALLLATSACENGTGPEHPFPPLEFRAPIRAMFPGMQDTLIAAREGRLLEPQEGSWSSDDPGVVEALPAGVVRAVALGEAVLRLQVDGLSDSLRIAVLDPPVGQIAFRGVRTREPQADSPLGGHLWVIPASAGEPRRVFDAAGGNVSNPTFSPDGCQIAFQYSAGGLPELWRVDLRTGVSTRVTFPGNPVGGAGSPSWSPLGDRIFFSFLQVIFYIHSIRPDGSDLTQHSSFGDGLAMFLDVFPDGRSLVYERIIRDSLSIESDLHRLDLDTEQSTLLFGREGLDEQFPALSPDGSLLAFNGEPANDEDLSVVEVLDLAAPERVPVQITPLVPTRITEEFPQGTPAVARFPSFSVDADWLAVSWDRDRRPVATEPTPKGGVTEIDNTLSEIYVIPLEHPDHAVRLTHFYSASAPDWGPECTAAAGGAARPTD